MTTGSGESDADEVGLFAVPEDYFARLKRSADAYEDAMRRAGIARAELSENRNRLDGEVYEASKTFRAILAEARPIQIDSDRGEEIPF